MSDSENLNTGEKTEQPVTLLEMLATAMSALLIAPLIALLVALLIWDAAHPDAPARLTIDVSPPAVVGPQYQVPVTVHNRGDKSAKDVVVHFELVAAAIDSVIAESDLTVDWLPRESSRDIVGLFARKSIASAVGSRVDVRGYVVP
jgi:uncharacterized protein (TIGR02588 family)